MTWEEELTRAVEDCSLQARLGDHEGIRNRVARLRERQVEHEELYFDSLDDKADKIWAAVRLVAYYNMLAALDAAAKGGTLNGKTVKEFLQSAYSSYRYGGTGEMIVLLEGCAAALGEGPDEKAREFTDAIADVCMAIAGPMPKEDSTKDHVMESGANPWKEKP